MFIVDVYVGPNHLADQGRNNADVAEKVDVSNAPVTLWPGRHETGL